MKLFNKLFVGVYKCYKKIELSKYYLRFPKNKKYPFYVFNIDGRVHHGGLADRLKSIVVIYAYCKVHDKKFKINFTFPFRLENILLPNKYDWIISEGDLSDSLLDTKIITSYIGELNIKIHNNRQVHIYNFGGGYLDKFNAKYNTDYTVSSIFNDLFKHNNVLKNRLENLKNKIGGPYISITYRFQSLLGDFYEGEYFKKKGLSVDQNQKNNLINQSIIALEEIKNSHPEMNILVTSDSKTFLSEVEKLPGVFIIPGETVHMDFTSDAEIEVYMKAFLDLFMISGAEKIIRVSGLGLYGTGFPYFASLLGNKQADFIDIFLK